MKMELTEQMNELVMKLLHYFITEKEYAPIILHGAQNEIWLENLEGDFEIVRIVTDYIHNDEQLEYDLLKTKQIARKIKQKTFSLSMNVISIFLNIGDNVTIGCSSVILGGVHIANGIAIGANSTVNKSFFEENICIAGCPAKKISNNGSLTWNKKNRIND